MEALDIKTRDVNIYHEFEKGDYQSSTLMVGLDNNEGVHRSGVLGEWSNVIG